MILFSWSQDVSKAGNVGHYWTDILDHDMNNFWEKKTRILLLPRYLKGKMLQVIGQGGPKSKILTYSIRKIGKYLNISVHFNKAFYSLRFLVKISLSGRIRLKVLLDTTIFLQRLTFFFLITSEATKAAFPNIYLPQISQGQPTYWVTGTEYFQEDFGELKWGDEKKKIKFFLNKRKFLH